MPCIRRYLAAAVVTVIIGVGAAFAQTPTVSPTPSSTRTTLAPASEPSTAAQVEKWSTKQWSTAKTKWAKEKVKWADCQQQSADQKLAGRKSWAFLYGCMT
jgi:hypothetical protein